MKSFCCINGETKIVRYFTFLQLGPNHSISYIWPLLALVFSVGVVGTRAQSLTPNAVATNPVPVTYIIGQPAANQQVWQKVTQAVGVGGITVNQTNQAYVELATGLNHLINGQWVASKEEIDISVDGLSASATNGQHQVYFPGDIFNGNIKLVMPDGQVMQSQPLGLEYFDGTNGALIALVTNSTGAILPSGNQVIYTNAFAGLNADLLYKYSKAGFEQDVVLREQPPDPSTLGLNPLTTRLQVLTEFIAAPPASVTSLTVPTDAGNLENDTLNFGTMRIGRGKAFLLGTNSPSVSVEKRWVTLNGRQFLIEEVPIVAIATAIDSLAPFVSQAGIGTKPVVSKNLVLPPPRLVRNDLKTRFLAKAAPPNRGFFLDYYTESGDSGGDFTFGANATYYISGEFDVSGNLTIQGGTVIKFDESASYLNGGIVPMAGVNISTGPYRPAIITSMNDNSVGETISGSSGQPGRYNCSALDFDTSPTFTGPVEYLYVRYAAVGLAFGDLTCPTLRHCQFVNVGTGVQNYDGGMLLVENVLLSGVSNYAFDGNWGGSFDAANLTIHDAVSLMSSSTPLYTTNCLFICVTNWGGTFHSANYYTNSNDAGIFQTVGAGSHYLTTNLLAIISGLGTNNIDPVLLADLQAKTSYPPLLLTNKTIAVNTNLIPQVPRDTNGSPILGYHYDPIDYIADLCAITNATLTLTNGVAIATCNEAGIELQDGSSMKSIGSPLYPNWLVSYQSVQEGTNLLGGTNLGSGISILPVYTSVMPSAQFQFTKFTCQAGGGINLYDCYPSAYSNLTVQECEFWVGGNNFTGNTNTVTVLNNNLFVESFVNSSLPGGTLNINDRLAITNNLFWGLSFNFYPRGNSNQWSVFNNTFDSGGMIQLPKQNSVNGYNAYLHNGNRLYPTNAFDIVTTTGMVYQAGPFGGTFYQPTNSFLLNKGNATASAVGLYHYTVVTNANTFEATNIVSIGYHYVGADQYGNPLDSNGDGIPDYLEDPDGNGIVDNGETNWGLAILTQPISQTVAQDTNVTLSVTAQGVNPISYQWYFNSTALAGATSSNLILNNVQPANQGPYFVIVSNFTGSLTSSVAQLTLTCDPTPSGLIGWWQGEGNAVDIVVGNNGIVTTNGVNFTNGVVGQATEWSQSLRLLRRRPGELG